VIGFATARLIRVMPIIVLAVTVSATYVLFRSFVSHVDIRTSAIVSATMLGMLNLPYLYAPSAFGLRNVVWWAGRHLPQMATAAAVSLVCAATLIVGHRADCKIRWRRRRASGLYHPAPSGAVSRADLAKYVISESRQQGAGLMIWPEGVTPIPTADYKTPAARPLNSRLETKKLQHAFGVGLPPWHDDTRSFITDMVRGETA
jgi:peptidoglycan/LPS O-acetylase OafA/YrhL